MNILTNLSKNLEDSANIFQIDSIRYSVILSIFIVGLASLYHLGLLKYVYDFSKGNPKIIVLILLTFGLIFIKEIYFTGKNYSFVFEIGIILLIGFFALVYNKDPKYKSIFIYLLIVYGIYRLGDIYKTKSIEDFVKNLNLGEYDKLSYDILVDIGENVCEFSGGYNEGNRKELTLDITEQYRNNEVCKKLIRENNLEFATKWEDPISSKGTLNEDQECDEGWYEQVYDKLFGEEKMCKPGLVCVNNKCTNLKKKLDI
jgi:hypothetical protein